MSAIGVLIVGSGKRVRETALPALQRLRSAFVVRGVVARTAKEIAVGGERYAVGAIEQLEARALEGVGLVYVAVAKDAVPAVLERLTRLDVGCLDLLLDTPVVRFKHFRHIERLSRFRNAWVAEDCAYLPWIDAVRRAVAAGAIGKLEGVLFYQSAYAYHGIATSKAVLGTSHVERGRRRALGKGFAVRELMLSGGTQAWMLEPRDYSIGRVALLGSAGSIADFAHEGRGHLVLEPVLRDGDVVALQLGDQRTDFDDDEIALLRGDPRQLGLTQRMEALKRVGFLRLLHAVAAGHGAYPLNHGIEDMVVDYHLQRLGLYRRGPLMDPSSPLARRLLTLVTRLGG